MTIPMKRYALDPTGRSPNNLVVAEEHTLTDNHIRVVVPIYGPVFAESFTLFDLGTRLPLERGVDYDVAELLQDPTLQFGKEIVQLALIKNPTVTNRVAITYQSLGGNYQNNSPSIGRALETLLADDRPVDWKTHVLDKPFQYNAAPHVHLLEDVVGFGPLVVSLERVAQAITLNNVPAFEALINWVQNYHQNWATDDDILNFNNVEKNISLKNLLFLMKRYNFNAITFRPETRVNTLGKSILFNISATNFHDPDPLYWTIETSEYPGTLSTMFGSMDGIVYLNNQEAQFTVVTKSLKHNFGRFKFRVLLRRNSITGPVIADSGSISLMKLDSSGASFTLLSSGMWEHVCCLEEPQVMPSAEAMFLIRDNLTFKDF